METERDPQAPRDFEAARQFWEDRYLDDGALPPPAPNPVLAQVATDTPPGLALELGCGPGGDALWLASRGWHVTAVDIAQRAVDRLTALAVARQLTDRLTACQMNLSTGLPDGAFDLVLALYLHSPFDLARDQMLRTAAAALAPDGRLLVVDHGSSAPWSWNQDPDSHFPPPWDLAQRLALDPARWRVDRAEASHRTATGPGGARAVVTDHVVLVTRID